MHLVVLKRNDVELPTTLPASLMPYVPASSEPFAADLDDEQHGRSPTPPPPPPSSTKHQNSWPGAAEADSTNNWSADNQWNEQQGAVSNNDQWGNSEQVIFYLCYYLYKSRLAASELVSLCFV